MEKHTKSVTPTGGKGGKKSPGAGAPKGKGSKAASAKGKVFHICSLESLDSCKLQPVILRFWLIQNLGK